MLTQLSTLKARLGVVDSADDPMLTRVLAAISARFDSYCNRTFARKTDVREEFRSDQMEVCLSCYPIESVSSFELKDGAADWEVLEPTPDFLIRSGAVLSLRSRLGNRWQLARVTYTGGYVLPGAETKSGETALPSEIEHACIEQVACWYQNRTKLGLVSVTDGTATTRFAQVELLPAVASMLKPYMRLMF